MNAPSIRKSRTIRTRLAKRKAPKRPGLIEINRHGLHVDGARVVPAAWLGADIDIERWKNAAIVGVRIFTDDVKVRGPFHRGVHITERWG